MQRPDDSEETVRKRLTVYHAQTSPLQQYYLHFKNSPDKPAPRYVKIDGTQPVDVIQKQIFSLLDKAGENV